MSRVPLGLIHRRGTLFLALIVTMAVGFGIAGNYVMPGIEVAEKRSNEAVLRNNLSLIREAIQLERMIDSIATFSDDWTPIAPSQPNPEFLGYLNELIRLGYLKEIPADPTIRADQWGPTVGKYFWVPTENFIKDPGFEFGDITGTMWATGSDAIYATTTTELSWPGEIKSKFGRSMLLLKP
jgi:hypothetical protein